MPLMEFSLFHKRHLLFVIIMSFCTYNKNGYNIIIYIVYDTVFPFYMA